MTSTSAAVKQLSDGNANGTVLGVATTDLIGFFGASYPGNPTGARATIAQPAGNAQAAVTRGQPCGIIATFASTQSPVSVAINTTAEQAFTVQSGTGGTFLLASGDVVFINKPTSQAGLAVGNARFSASNSLGITFGNATGTAITPTASEIYGGVILRGFNSLSATLTPAAVPANTTVEQQFTGVTGLRVGELVQVVKPTSQAGLDIVGMRVVANNTLGITFANFTAAAITPTAAQAYLVMCLGGLDAVNNEMELQVNIISALAAGVATITTAEIASIPAANLLATDTVKGVSKDTLQAGIMAGSARVSSAGNLAITFVNPTVATVTPTASHVYNVSFSRKAPAAPLINYSQALTPVSVAANTSAEQTFTVTGLVAGSPVWVNKPSATTGLGIAGVRVSAANTLAINFLNLTATAITPPAETYLIGNFQVPIDTTDGRAYLQTAAGVIQQTAILANAHRTALVNLGLEAGA